MHIIVKKTIMALLTVFAGALFLLGGCGKEGDGKDLVGTEPLTGFNVVFFRTQEDSDAILIASPDANIMIDTGLMGGAPALIDSLTEKGVGHLDMLILTHPDKDHIGGAQAVLNNLAVDRLILSRATKNSEEQILLNIAMDREELVVDIPTGTEEFTFGDLKLTVFPAWQDEYAEINDYSVAALAEYAGRKFFFPGDAERERITELLGEYDIGDIDVYKLPHHGRDGKKSDKLLERLKPEYCVVTARKPGKKTGEKIAEMGCELFSTFDGEIIFLVDPDTGELTVSSG